MEHQAPESGFVSGLKAGSLDAWRDLYARCGGMIYRLARGMVGAEDAEDVAQEAFLQAFRKRHQFRGNSAKLYEAWLYRIAVNKCRDWCRKKLCNPVTVTASLVPDVAAAAPSVEHRLNDLDLIQNALQSVAPHLRALLLLNAEGRSYREICRIMKIKSKGTVCERLGLAREQLREALLRLGWSD
ncbi:MAG: RNA polymerase sigma factor [Gemmataceae bacterium]|nr:RNA polymerase sigma factor [Gemmataceae bacterium]